MGDFKAQGLANTAWAFATVDRSDALLMTALGKVGERCMSDFSAQEMANIA